MKCNMGKTDRMIRIAAGVAIMVYGAYVQTWWGAVGAVPLLTGIIGVCPAYLPFGLSTRKKD